MCCAFFHRLALRVVFAFVTAALVAGCESLFEPAPPPPSPAPPAPAPEAPRAVRVVPPPPRPAPAPPSEIKLVGLSEDEVQALLGPPSSATDQPPAKVWQYRAGNCAVDVYFYLDVGRNAFYALHYDNPAPTSPGSPVQATVSAAHDHDAADRCLTRVYNAHRDH
jgi:hypothetical protein